MKICEVKNCGRVFYGISWCRLHWRRWKKHGNVLADGKKHGKTGTSIFNRWRQIKRRTTKKEHNGFKNYGGRGIKMCQEWMESFESFYKYIGDPPTPKHTIERINNDKGYEPGNIRWATYFEQALNRRHLKKNKNGYMGVYKTKNTFYSSIEVKGKRIYLGSFPRAVDAHEAYTKSIKKYYGTA